MSTPTSEARDLTTLDEAGFAALYRERIEPIFSAHESARRAALGVFWLRFGIAGAIVAAGAIWLYWSTGSVIVALFALGALGFIIYIVARGPLDAVAKQVKANMLIDLASLVGARYELTPASPPAFERFEALRLAPNHDRAKFEDHFSGTRRDASFDLYEGFLERRRRSNRGPQWVTVFRGQFIRVAFARAFLGVTIVRRDFGVFNGLNGGGLERVGLVDPNFERIFEVYSSDQVEARFLVHPAMMERLVDLEAKLQGKRLRCAFEQGDLLIAIEGGDLFEVGDMFKPLPDEARARRIVDELAALYRLIDAVLTAQAERPRL